MTVEIREVLTEWHETILSSDAMLENLFGKLMLYPESPVYSLVGSLQEKLTKQASIMTKDLDGWLDWYRFDNQMGERGMEATSNSKFPMRKITGLDDLIWLIEASHSNITKNKEETSTESVHSTSGGVL